MGEVGVGLDVGSDGVVLVRGGTAAVLDVPVSAALSGRVGDQVPLVVIDGEGHDVLHAHELYADTVVDALEAAAVPTPDPVTSPVAVAVPGWWTKRARGLVGRALARRGLGQVLLVHDAEAAVLGARAAGTLLPSTVMVVDLGARSCSAAIVENGDLAPRAVGSPGPVHLEGGDDLDALVLHHVLDSLAALGTSLDPKDPDHVEAARAFLADCRRLREDLSGSSVVTVAPSLPGEARRLRVVREELEGLAEPWLEGVLRLVGGCLDQYRGEVDAVLLVGGLARTPLVARAISAELDLDVLVDHDPRTTAARGAATLAVPVAPPPERRRSRLRRPERQERRRGRRALGAAARDELVALPAAPTAVQPELPPAAARLEAPMPVEDVAVEEVAVEDVAVPAPVERPVVEDRLNEASPVEEAPVEAAGVDDIVDAVVVEAPVEQAPAAEDPDIEDALAEQAVVEAEVEAEPTAAETPEEPEPQVLAPETVAEPEPEPEPEPVPTVVASPVLEAPVADEQVVDQPAAEDPPVEEPTPDSSPDAPPHPAAHADADAETRDDVSHAPEPEIAVEAPPIGARVRRSARLLDAALGASALDPGPSLAEARRVDDAPTTGSVRDASAEGGHPDERGTDDTGAADTGAHTVDDAAEAVAEELPVPPDDVRADDRTDDQGADETDGDAPGTALALIEPDEPAPARPREPEPEPQGLAARLRRRRQERRVRRGKAPEPTPAQQISAADAVRALRATLDRQPEVDPGDGGALDDAALDEVVDLTPVPWARAAEMHERLRLAEAGLIDADTLTDHSVLSGGRS